MTQRDLAALRKRLLANRVVYRQIADDAGVSWSMVWKVLHGKKTSARVLDVAVKLSA